MTLTDVHGVLAVGVGEDGANRFLGTDFGKAVVTICAVVGLLIVVSCIFKMVKSITSGRPGEGFKVLVFGLVVGGLLFDLDITVKGIGYMGGLIGKIFDSTNSLLS